MGGSGQYYVLPLRDAMKTRELIASYLDQYPLISIATACGDRPWASTVYFAFDSELSLFFISRTFRLHSQEIAANPRVAATICRPHDKPFEVPCRGLQVEGACYALEERDTASSAFALYMARFPSSKRLHASVDDVLGSVDRRIYFFQPERFVLFDEENFASGPQQELIIKQ